MANTGMTRRIDELGRLVIPKEIRKNLKIKENDQVEINVIDNKIILNKYNSFDSDRIIDIMLRSMKKVINKNIMLTSRDEVIGYVLINKKKQNKTLNEEFMNIIEKRKEITNYLYEELYYTVCPLIVNGDLYGSLIVYSNDEINDNEMDIIRYSKVFLENYLE